MSTSRRKTITFLKRQIKRWRRKIKSARNKIKSLRHTQPTEISDAGVDFISSFEGYVPSPAPDPVGYCTVGFGHLIRYGPCRTEDRKRFGILSYEQALDLLKSDLKEYSDGVSRYVTRPITQSMFDALVSFAYNNGLGAFQSSTLLRVVNGAFDLQDPPTKKEIRAQFARWVNAGSPPRPLAGLVRRRRAEADLFYSG